MVLASLKNIDYEFRDRMSPNIPRTLRLKEHFGHAVLVETNPFKMAVVRKSPGDPIEKSVLYHPRYVPKGMQHELIEFEGSRHGRSVNILLPAPKLMAGTLVTILNFKGCGADAREEFEVHPRLWWDDGVWTERSRGEHRVWGGVREYAGKEEFQAYIFRMLNVPHVPYLSLNPVPYAISKEIARITDSSPPRLVQLVRGLRTNIRCSVLKHAGLGNGEGFNPEIGEVASRVSPLLDGQIFAEGDARLFAAQIILAMFGKRILFNGELEDNRFIDGLFTDDENFGIRDYRCTAIQRLAVEIIRSRLPFLLWGFDKDKYAAWASKESEPELDGMDLDLIKVQKLLGPENDAIVKRATEVARNMRGHVNWDSLSYEQQCDIMHGLWEGRCVQA